MSSRNNRESTPAAVLAREITCQVCGKEYWWQLSRPRSESECPNCWGKTTPLARPNDASRSQDSRTALATLEQGRAGSNNTALGPALPDLSVLFRDVKQLMEQASAPIEYRSRTFWEKFRSIDLVAKQIEQKLQAGYYADQLLCQRLHHIRRMQEIAAAIYKEKEAEMERQTKQLEVHLKQLKIQEEIRHLKAVEEAKAKTQQVKELGSQMKLLNPVPAKFTPPAQKKDPLTEVIEDVRNQARMKAAAKQAVLSDLLKAVQMIFAIDIDDAEKAARIRVVTDAYGQELDALPKPIREYLERVESDDYDSVEENDESDGDE